MKAATTSCNHSYINYDYNHILSLLLWPLWRLLLVLQLVLTTVEILLAPAPRCIHICINATKLLNLGEVGLSTLPRVMRSTAQQHQ